MTDACTSPGSRSTPLVLSLARTPRLRAWSHVDERVAGFFALGLAKATGRPVAVACTSGTAAAELAPAVIEAARGARAAARADRRPPAGAARRRRRPDDRPAQALRRRRQVVRRGRHARGDARSACAGCARSPAAPCGPRSTAGPGPVHLNFPLREPLVLDGPLPDEDPCPGRADGRPWVAHPVVPAPAELPHVPVAPAPRAVVVAGRDERDPALGEAIAAFAAAARYPLLADPLSGARRGPAAIAHYDALLRDERLAAELRPELVLRVGDLPTSKPLRAWLAGLDDASRSRSTPRAPGRTRPASSSARIAANPRATLAALDAPSTATPASRRGSSAGAPPTAPPPARSRRRSASELSEPRVAAELGRRAAAARRRCSSPPRCRSATSRRSRPRATDAPRVLSNRGANGIDGTVAAALGAAAAGDGPGRAAHRRRRARLRPRRRCCRRARLGLDLTIVLVNNDGGGIFDFLPVAREGDGLRAARRDAARARLRAGRRAVRRAPRARRRRRRRCAPSWRARSAAAA